MLDLGRRIRPGISEIQPYVPGLTDDQLKHTYGLSRVVKLNANENALGASPMALAAIREEMNMLHHYPDGSSDLLRRAIAEFHGLKQEHVLVGNGSDDLIKLLSETFLDPGDEIVVPHPSFSQYTFGAYIMRANVKPVSLTADFRYDVEAFLKEVNEKTKLVYLCSPNNPTGDVATQEAVEWLLERLPENVVLIIDLAYNDFSTRPDRVMETSKLLEDPRVVLIHTFSKLYGLAGLRVGYGLANPELWSFVNRVREPFNVNRLAQRAAAAALADEGHRTASVQHALRAREFYRDLANELGLTAMPTEANFVLLHTGDGAKTTQKLMEQGVMVRTGFRGLEEYVRITFGTDEENELCASALKKTL
ncbi:histidinol-phosphate transaminase [Alicyclobacillus tolerans]|uniref:histidinol-phosphate transaminase n=1 Tax=Alicyclobacillus tolerans TaxID=90970 RepID=UPI001F017392|nr:histidinol-phosphate transaminase [Alicyclobacillus tolerans]MCF8563498.1 histidinol-phosphate transaminase [Alicyclobacillus tolerans]